MDHLSSRPAPITRSSTSSGRSGFVTLDRRGSGATTTITYDLHANMTGADGKPIGTFRTPTVADRRRRLLGGEPDLRELRRAGRPGACAPRRRRPRRVQELALPRLAGHDLPQPRPPLLRRLADRRARRLHLRRRDGATSTAATFTCCADGYITAASTPAEQTYGLVFVNSRITGAPGCTDLSRPSVARLRAGDVCRDRDVRRRAAGGLAQLGPAGPRRNQPLLEVGSTGPGAAAAPRVAWAKRVLPEGDQDTSAVTVLRGH